VEHSITSRHPRPRKSRTTPRAVPPNIGRSSSAYDPPWLPCQGSGELRSNSSAGVAREENQEREDAFFRGSKRSPCLGRSCHRPQRTEASPIAKTIAPASRGASTGRYSFTKIFPLSLDQTFRSFSNKTAPPKRPTLKPTVTQTHLWVKGASFETILSKGKKTATKTAASLRKSTAISPAVLLCTGLRFIQRGHRRRGFSRPWPAGACRAGRSRRAEASRMRCRRAPSTPIYARCQSAPAATRPDSESG